MPQFLIMLVWKCSKGSEMKNVLLKTSSTLHLKNSVIMFHECPIGDEIAFGQKN